MAHHERQTKDYSRINYTSMYGSTWYADHRESTVKGYSKLAQIINPANSSLRVLYAGSGGDLLTPLLTTNSDTFVYVNNVGLDEVYGWGRIILDRIKSEGTRLKISDFTRQNNGDDSVISFHYGHSQDSPETTNRLRKIHFYKNNYFKFWPPEYEDGYEILIVRGESPRFDDKNIQLKQLGNKMSVGGFFISDRPIVRYINPNWLGFSEVRNEANFRCGHARIYRKEQSVDEAIISKLFRLDDLTKYLDDYHFAESFREVSGAIKSLLALCQSLPEEMREEARLRAGDNMRWLGSEKVLKNDYPDGWFNFAFKLSKMFKRSFS